MLSGDRQSPPGIPQCVRTRDIPDPTPPPRTVPRFLPSGREGTGDTEPLKERQRLGKLVSPLPFSGTTESCPPLREFRSGYRDKVFLTLLVYLNDFDLMLFSFLPQSIKGESLPPDLNRLRRFRHTPFCGDTPQRPEGRIYTYSNEINRVSLFLNTQNSGILDFWILRILKF